MNKFTKTLYLVMFVLLGAVGVGTASALVTITLAGDVVITDDLTVDTSTLFVDSANHRVGIGETSPTQKLDVDGNVLVGGDLEVTGEISSTTITAIENNQYVPFASRASAGFKTCDVAGGSFDLDAVRIESTNNKDFIVTSIIMAPEGVDDATDNVQIFSFNIDGLSGFFRSIDVTGTGTQTRGFEILGLAQVAGDGNLPHQIALDSTLGSVFVKDIKFDIICDASVSTDIKFNGPRIIASGWKQSDDTISVTYFENHTANP